MSYIWAKMKGQLSLPFKDVRVTFVKHMIAVAEAPALAKASSLSTLHEIKHLPFWIPLFHLIFSKEEEKSQQKELLFSSKLSCFLSLKKERKKRIILKGELF